MEPGGRPRRGGRSGRLPLAVPLAVPDRPSPDVQWLITLRWSSIAGQIATVLGVDLLVAIDVPLVPLFAIIAIEALSNLGFALWLRRRPGRAVHEGPLAAIMALDVGFLTGLLFFTGGPSNPFSFLYLVNIALAAVALRAQWTWMLVALALAAVGVLPLTDYRPLPLDHLPPAQRDDVLQ